MTDHEDKYSWTGWLKEEIERNKSCSPQKGRARPQKISGRYMYSKLVELGAVDPEPENKKGKRSSERCKPVQAAQPAPSTPAPLKRMSASGGA